MPKPENPVLMGVVGAPHGVKGHVRVKSYTADPVAIGDYGPLHTGDGRVLEIAEVQAAKNIVVVRFNEIRFRDEAEALKGTKLFVDRSQLPDDELEADEFFVDDLIGMAVFTEDGNAFGKVKDVANYGAGDLLDISRVDTGKSELFVFEAANFPVVDFETGRMVIRPPGEIFARPDDAEGAG